ncbi:MAG: hypothetical protein JXQ76_09145 [Campylobacterales bacterium]|nr:hypothetical protein [Campylobacterales bacterium]
MTKLYWKHEWDCNTFVTACQVWSMEAMSICVTVGLRGSRSSPLKMSSAHEKR